MEERLAAKLLGLAAVAANSAAADRAATSSATATAGVESEEDEEDRWSRQGSYEGGSEEDEEEDDGVGGKRKRMSADDRKARNRERNRLHARKTRQRKKQHVQELQLKIWGLRQERQRLLQLSSDHRTAGVLLALSCSPKQCIQGTGSSSDESPRLPPALSLPQTAAASAASSGRDWSQEVASHEDALRKITQEFESMDGSQQVGEEEEASISVGRGRAYSASSSGGGGKGGSRGVKGTLADRTALRRERNRMHAKRTRNRKKLFVEACSVMIDKMKVENAQLGHEIKAAGIHLPQDNWTQEVRETVPEEPLPEYLAALWDFAEGKSHSPKAASGTSSSSSTSTTTALVTPPATPRPSPRAVAARQSRETSSLSSASACTTSSSWSSSSVSCTSANSRQQRGSGDGGAATSASISEEPPRPPSPPPLASSQRPAAVLAAAANAVANSTPGQALEDATALCAFMEAAQTRSVKRARVAPSTSQQQQPRGWSDDHGSTTSESRGGSEFSEEDSAFERKSTDGSGASSSSEAGAVLSPAFWTSRQVLERYVLPRQQLLQG